MKGSRVRWIILAGLLLRLILWVFQDWPCGDDGMRYLQESINLVEHGTFSTDVAEAGVPNPDAHDLPLWPMLMAVILFVSRSVSVTQYAAVFLNILFMGGTLFFICRLLKERPFCVGERGLCAACMLLLFMPESLPYSLFHMPDMTAVFFLTLGLWAFYWACTKNTRFIWLFAVASGFAILSKPICIPVFLAFSGALLFVLRGGWTRRIGVILGVLCVVGLMLTPWVVRNQRAFGTPGLTTISGTNLYEHNLARYVASMPQEARTKIEVEMREFAQTLPGKDKMQASKEMGAFAKDKLLHNLPGYIGFTLKRHPRLYVGTATVALLRYAGFKKLCYALEDKVFGGSADPDPSHRVPYEKVHVYLALAVQGFAWLCLALFYGCIGYGVFASLKKAWAMKCDLSSGLLMVSPVLAVLLLAMVIGPVTATRYRFIMIPFFAILAAMAAARFDKAVKGD